MFKKLLVFVVLFAWGSVSFAGESSGKVTHLMVHEGNVVMFALAGGHTNKPTCGAGTDEWAISLTTDKGKAMYSMLLSAAAQRVTVKVNGSNHCAAWPDREAPYFMYINY